MTTTLPNLDAMDHDDLVRFHGRHFRSTRAVAAALIGDHRAGYTQLATDCACYAINKATAIGRRLRGDIRGAQIYEAICDRIYAKLPEDVRW